MRFSSRLPWDLPANRLSRALEQRRRSGARIFDLTLSNPTSAGLVYPDEIRSVLADPAVLRYEPHPSGALAAREAVADCYAARGAAVHPDQVVLAAGTSEAYAWLFKLLCDPGDQVLVPRPSYPLFDFLAGLEAVGLVQYPLVYYGRWWVDFEALARALTPRTRAILVVHPNNPTGSLIHPSQQERLAELCAQRGLALISDEVFSDYPLAPGLERIQSLCRLEQPLVFSLNGLSKSAGLPQMKLAWIVVGGPARLRTEAVHRLELIADTYLSVGTPVQHALPALMRLGESVRRQIHERVRGNLARLAARFGPESPCQLLAPEAGWYAVVRVPQVRSEEQWCLELLERYGVLVQPGYFFDFLSEAYLVVSLLAPPEDLDKFWESIL